jgi:hypothetical protein
MKTIESMPHDEWDFESQLVKLISNYLDSSEPLIYRGVNLRSAISRHLYYLLRNNKKFREYLYDIDKKCIKNIYEFSEIELVSVAIFLKKKNNLKSKVFLEKRIATIHSIKNLMRESFLNLILIKIKFWYAVSNIDPNLDILLYIGHKKFLGQLSCLGLQNYKKNYIVSNWGDAKKLGIGISEALKILPVYSKRSNPTMSIWLSVTKYFDGLEAVIMRSNPKLILYLEGDSVHHELLALIGKKYSIKSVCIQWGAFPFPGLLNGFRGLTCTYFLSWGPLFIKQLKPFNPEPIFIPVGHPGLTLSITDAIRDSIVFLLNTSGSSPSDGFNRPHALFLDMIKWVAESYPYIRILIRPHPTLPLNVNEQKLFKRYKNIEIEESLAIKLEATLSKSMIAIGFTSSTLIEAAGYGVLPVVINPYPWSYQPDLKKLGIGIECKDVLSAKNCLTDLLANKGALIKKMQAELILRGDEIFHCIGDDSAELIMKEINNLISEY